MSGAVVIGVGPGIGTSVARAFAREGHPVGLIARSGSTLATARGALPEPGVPTYLAEADAADPDRLGAALAGFESDFGVPDVVVYNAAIIQRDALGDLDLQRHLEAWSVNVVGAITTAAHVLPQMAGRGHGTFVITGGMPEASPDYLSLSLGKAGVRALVAALDAQFAPAGVHVATVTVDGPVAPNTDFDPDDIAEHYVRLHAQPRPRWEREVVHSESRAKRPA
jgi:NAD(P)-dependent dehydrogenase (short-subunit alcohol dehydrogenase family)